MKPNREHIGPPRAGPGTPMRLLAVIAVAAAMASPLPSRAVERSNPALGAPVLSPTIERKIREARATGSWLVEEGEQLYTIARYFVADEEQAQALAREIRAANAQALDPSDATRLVVGSRLRLPPRLVGATSAGAAPATLPERIEAPAADPQPAVLVPGPPIYVDRLIGGAAAEEEQREEAEPRDLSPGLRATAIEYRHDRRTHSFGTDGFAHGIALRNRAETERFGDFLLEAEMGRERDLLPPPARRNRNVGRATLYHEQFAITESLAASSALGAVRLGASPWLASSYRIHLPTTIASGATTTLDGRTVQVRASYGRLARLTGLAIQDLELMPGTLAMLEANARITEGWRAGAAAVVLRGAQALPDHWAVTAAAEYGEALGRNGAKVQALVDDRGGAAFWADARHREGRLAQRFGAYHVEPGTLFGDGSLPRDSRGAYWRGEYRTPDATTSFGAELNQTNLERDPLLGGLSSAGGYGNLALRLDRSTNVGAGLSLREERPRTARGQPRTVGLLTAFGSRIFPWGLSRLDFAFNVSRPSGLASESTRALTWTHDWPRLGLVHVNTLLSVSEERLADRVVRRRSASIGLRGPAFETVHWDAAYTWVEVEDPIQAQRNYNVSAGIDWTPARHWVLRLQWLRNQIETSAPDPLVPFVRENVVQVLARYEETSGTPYPRVGGPGGRSGTGWIEGAVFYDENGDGVRQANERGAPGVLVILNGRSTQVTGSDGRFRFGLVASGEHGVTLSVDRVPLPWGLRDESPRRVRVEVRDGARLDIPLNRIAP